MMKTGKDWECKELVVKVGRCAGAESFVGSRTEELVHSVTSKRFICMLTYNKRERARQSVKLS